MCVIILCLYSLLLPDVLFHHRPLRQAPFSPCEPPPPVCFLLHVSIHHPLHFPPSLNMQRWLHTYNQEHRILQIGSEHKRTNAGLFCLFEAGLFCSTVISGGSLFLAHVMIPLELHKIPLCVCTTFSTATMLSSRLMQKVSNEFNPPSTTQSGKS